MTTFLILGGYGYTGKLLAKHLLAGSQAKIILAGRNLEKAQAFADKLNNERVSAVRVDAADGDSLRAALQNVDMVLVAAPTTQHAETVIRAALDKKVDYLDVQYSSRKLTILNKLASEIEEAGLCFVTEAGYHPGLPSAMVRYAAMQMDSIESALTAGYLNMGKSLPYSEAVDELMEGFIDYQDIRPLHQTAGNCQLLPRRCRNTLTANADLNRCSGEDDIFVEIQTFQFGIHKLKYTLLRIDALSRDPSHKKIVTEG